VTLYKDVFSQGFRGGWSGGAYMASAALPGFLAIGPMFHFYKGVSGDSNAAAVALTAATESMIFYGSETKNAQTAFNQDAQKRGAQVIGRVQSQFNPRGQACGCSADPVRACWRRRCRRYRRSLVSSSAIS